MKQPRKRRARPPETGTRGATPPPPVTPVVPPPRQAGWGLWASVVVLLLAIELAYLPAFNAGFVRWDDQYYVEANPLLSAPDGLQKIWNPFGHDTQQFYPLVFSAYWLEYRLWGLDASGYHAVNVGLHAVNALLVLGVVLELGVSTPVAVATAAVFALHPVQVASVAWISELKNTLSGVFYLLCAWAYIRHRRSGAWSTYGLCLLAFVGALLSKTQTVTLPASVLLADWALQRLGRIRRTRFVNVVARLLPMLVLGAVAGWITMRFEQEPWTRTFAMTERLLVITNAAAFYARTFFAPFWLSPIYPEWHVAAFDWQWWTGPIVCAVGVGALVLWRRRIPDLVLWGIAHFYIALIPVIGLFSFNFQTYTLVADHFLYLSVLGGGLAVAIAAERASVVWRPPSRQPVIAAAGLLLLIGCSVQTYRECRHWQNNLAFWTRVRDQDPNGFVANYNLGNHYRYTGQWSQAVPFYRRAAEIRPRTEYPFQRYAEALDHTGGARAVADMCTRRLARDPQFYFATLQRGISEEQLGQAREAVRDYERTMQLAPRGSAPWKDAQQGRARLVKQQGASG